MVTPSQSRTSPGSLGVGSSHGARPAATARPRPGPGTHPRGLLSRTCQQTPVDGRHLRLQLRRHLPSSFPPALTPLPPPQGPRLRHSPGGRYRHFCPRQSVRSRPGGGGWRRRRAAWGQPAGRDGGPLRGPPGLSARVKSLPRPCPGEGHRNPRTGTVASFYRVLDQERGNNTQGRKQSFLGTVVVPGTAGKTLSPRSRCGSCSPSPEEGPRKWPINGRGFSAQLESREEHKGKKRSPGKRRKRKILWEPWFSSPNHICSFSCPQILERCLALGSTFPKPRKW